MNSSFIFISRADLGSSLYAAGRPDEAIPLFQKAIRLSPFGPSYIYREFGVALRNTGRFEEAVSALKKAIQLAPDNFGAHLALATTYSMMGRENLGFSYDLSPALKVH